MKALHQRIQRAPAAIYFTSARRVATAAPSTGAIFLSRSSRHRWALHRPVPLNCCRTIIGPKQKCRGKSFRARSRRFYPTKGHASAPPKTSPLEKSGKTVSTTARQPAAQTQRPIKGGRRHSKATASGRSERSWPPDGRFPAHRFAAKAARIRIKMQGPHWSAHLPAAACSHACHEGGKAVCAQFAHGWA